MSQRIAIFILFVIVIPVSLMAQDAADSAAVGQKYKTPPEIVKIIELAESKLYSPIDQGLKSFRITQKLALDGSVRTMWFKAPDKVKGIMGRHKPIELRSPGKVKPVVVELRTPDVVARRGVNMLMGKPISYFLPYGTFEILEKDEGGTHLRFTGDQADKDNYIWSHADFYLDEEFRLTKIKEKMAVDNRIEEHIIRLKPYKEGEKLLVIDTLSTILGVKSGQSIVNATYHYKEVGPYTMIDSITRIVQAESKEFTETYEDMVIDEDFDDSIFEKKE